MRTLSSLVLAALLLTSCGSVGMPDLGGILGSPSSSQPSDVRGTVTGIDSSARRVDLDVQYVNNLRESRTGQSIYYDDRTRVEYNGQTYNVQDLERGDQVSIRGFNDNGRYVAEVITVTRNVRQ